MSAALRDKGSLQIVCAVSEYQVSGDNLEMRLSQYQVVSVRDGYQLILIAVKIANHSA